MPGSLRSQVSANILDFLSPQFYFSVISKNFILSHFQIHNWLSNSPSEMESYIRPGCVVLSLYLSMPLFAWNQVSYFCDLFILLLLLGLINLLFRLVTSLQLEEDLLNYVKSLVKDIEFWGNGRFLIHTDRQMVSHKEGSIF